MILDHVFALPRGSAAGSLVEATHEAADRFSAALAGAGFSEGSRRRHPGQGTSNRRLFLDDLMIECLLVEDEAELGHSRGAVLGFRRRFAGEGASALGLGFRSDDPAGACGPDFESVAYRPVYLPEPLHIDVGTVADERSPLLFHLPFAVRPAGVPDDGEPRAHANGARTVAGLHFESPIEATDVVRRALAPAGTTFAAGPECLHVRLAGCAPGFELDLRPLFALRLHA